MILDILFEQVSTTLQIGFSGTETLDVSFGEIMAVADTDWFDGSYIVTPTANGTKLATSQKRMREDLTIKPIPFFEVSNDAGGNTIYIGGEN